MSQFVYQLVLFGCFLNLGLLLGWVGGTTGSASD